MLKEYTQFLLELNQNNNKEWFDVNRTRYKELQAEFLLFVGEVIPEIAKYDETIKHLTPTDCTFRINRDVRFSPNKSPYKTSVSGFFAFGGKGSYKPGYYFEIDYSGNMVIAGGQHFIDPKDLYLIRTKVESKVDQLRKILSDKEFVKFYKEIKGEKLKTCPKGFSKDSPNLDLLVHKSFYSSYNIDIKGKSDQDVKKEILLGFGVINPLVQYMREILI